VIVEGRRGRARGITYSFAAGFDRVVVLCKMSAEVARKLIEEY